MIRRILLQPHLLGGAGVGGLLHTVDAMTDGIAIAPAAVMLAASAMSLLLLAAMPDERVTLHSELARLRTWLLDVHLPELGTEKRKVPGATYLCRKLAELVGRGLAGHTVYAEEVTPFITDVAELGTYRKTLTGTDEFTEWRAFALDALARWRAELPTGPSPTAPFGQRLQQVLDDHEWSHERLGREMGVSRAAVTMWVNGTRHPGRAHLAALVRVTQMPSDFWAD
jgi:hypothetical protein